VTTDRRQNRRRKSSGSAPPALTWASALEEDVVGSALYSSQISYYDQRTNRCYVELTTQTADTTKTLDYLNRNLFDGQTKELLAYARIQKDRKGGMVFDRQHQTATLENAGWDDANAYIDAMMLDDRRN
jgi:hypothetical protein